MRILKMAGATSQSQTIACTKSSKTAPTATIFSSSLSQAQVSRPTRLRLGSTRRQNLINYLEGFRRAGGCARNDARRDDNVVVAARVERVADVEHVGRMDAEALREPADAVG